MGQKHLIYTNNPLVAERLAKSFDVRFYPKADDLSLLLEVRDLIHAGHLLLTQPLSGSVKPWETPYRSVMVSRKPAKEVDFDSLEIIEQSIATLNRHSERKARPQPDRIEDLKLVDLSLIESALPSVSEIELL